MHMVISLKKKKKKSKEYKSLLFSMRLIEIGAYKDFSVLLLFVFVYIAIVVVNVSIELYREKPAQIARTHYYKEHAYIYLSIRIHAYTRTNYIVYDYTI